MTQISQDPPEPMSTSRSHPFWRTFASRYWEQGSGEFEQPTAGPLISEANAFSAAVALADSSRQGKAVVEACIWLDGQKQLDPLPLLPLASDGSFHAYGERVLRDSGAREFTTLLPELHYYNPDLLAEVRSILLPLTAACGLPSGWTDTAMFVGRYERTPFGIHYGPMSVMTVPVIGRKTFRVWSEAEIARHPELVGVTSYNPEASISKLLSGKPGDILYWPSRDWHIAEADTGLTAALSFGFWASERERHPLRQIMKMAERLLAAAPAAPNIDMIGSVVPHEVSWETNSGLPSGWKHYLDAFRNLASSRELEKELLAEFLRQASGFGLKHIPRQPPRILDRQRPFSIDPLSGLQTARYGDHLIIAIFGQVFTVPFDNAFAGFLVGLIDMETDYDEVQRIFGATRAGSLSAEEAWSVLLHLADQGAILQTET